MERFVADETQKPRELLVSDGHFPVLGDWHLQVLDRIAIDVALLLRPLHAPLHAAEVIPLRCYGKVVCVGPRFHVVGPKIVGPEIRIAIEETLQAVAIPLVRFGRAVVEDPLQERIDDGGERFRGNLPLLGLPHERVETVVSLVFVLPKGVPRTPDGDVPTVARFPEPRLRSSCHDKPSSYRLMKTTQQAERFASRASDGGSSGALFDLSLGTILYPILYQVIRKSS